MKAGVRMTRGWPRDESVTQLDRELAREERLRASRRNVLVAAAAVALVAGLVVGAVALATRPASGRAAPAFATASSAVAAAPAAAPAPAGDLAASAKAPAGATAPRAARPPTAAKPAPKAAPAAAAPKAPKRKPAAKTAVVSAGKVQRFTIAIGAKGYAPSRIVAKAGTPIVLTVGKGEGCAAGFDMPKLGVHIDNSAGSASAELGALKAGSYQYTCSMGMVTGELVVR
jgi:hypothetical protein